MTQFEIHADNHSAKVTATGNSTEETKEQMSNLLNAIDPLLDGEITELEIEVSTRQCDDEIVLEHSTDDGSDSDGGETGNGNASGNRGPMEETPDRGPRPPTADYHFINEEDREEGPLTSGTSQHLIVSLLDESAEAMTTAEIQDELERVNDGTISGSLTKLYERKLIDREARNEYPPQGGRPIAEHSLTEYGREQLEEIGHITQDEWINQ